MVASGSERSLDNRVANRGYESAGFSEAWGEQSGCYAAQRRPELQTNRGARQFWRRLQMR